MISTYYTYVDLTDIDVIYGHTVTSDNGYVTNLCVSTNPGCLDGSNYSILNGTNLRPANNTVTNDYYTNVINVKNLTGKYYVGVLCHSLTGTCSITVDEIIMLKKVFQDLEN